MKIGILTYHRTTNFGAILQTYALQRYLQLVGHEAEVIDYSSETLKKRYTKDHLYKYLNPRELRRLILYNSCYRDNMENFNEFLNKYVRLSNRDYTSKDIKEAESNYDLFIVGSDQIWNEKISGKDLTFFLDFVNDDGKKAAYAASFGIDRVTVEFSEWCKSFLVKFPNVSVREKSGVKVYQAITGKTCKFVMDPSFLISQQNWISLADHDVVGRRKIKGKYVLIYCMRESKNLFDFARAVAEQINGEVVYINDRLLKKKGVHNLFYVTPQEWLGLFANASYVITNSFHGVVFSIIMNKDFYVELLPFTTGVNRRMTDLLEIVGLEDRLLQDNNEQIIPIDYVCCNNRVKKQLEISLSYLGEITSS